MRQEIVSPQRVGADILGIGIEYDLEQRIIVNSHLGSMTVGAEVVVVVVVADDELGEGQGVFPIELSVNFGGGVDSVNQVLAGC